MISASNSIPPKTWQPPNVTLETRFLISHCFHLEIFFILNLTVLAWAQLLLSCTGCMHQKRAETLQNWRDVVITMVYLDSLYYL